MTAISRIHARQILDSRGNPTVEVEVTLESGATGRAAVPSGASTGVHEALELRDGGQEWGGKGVTQAVENVNGEIAAAVRGLDAADQRGARRAADRARRHAEQGPARRERDPRRLARGGEGGRGRGARSRSSATSAARRRATLPVPMLNVINGGAHAENSIDLQEFMLVPAGADTFAEALRIGAEVFHALKALLHERGFSTGVGDEGGFAPDLGSSEEAIEAVLEAAERAGHRDRVAIALDPAATELYEDGHYRFEGNDEAGDGMVQYLARLVERYPIVSIEDGLAEDDWTTWRALTEVAGSSVQLVGDDLFVTNPERLRRGIMENVGNAILIKVNQIGTLTETLDTMTMAREAATPASCRTARARPRTRRSPTSPSPPAAARSRPARRRAASATAKYNQLLRIEEELGDRAVYPGWDAFPRFRR